MTRPDETISIGVGVAPLVHGLAVFVTMVWPDYVSQIHLSAHAARTLERSYRDMPAISKKLRRAYKAVIRAGQAVDVNPLKVKA